MVRVRLSRPEYFPLAPGGSRIIIDCLADDISTLLSEALALVLVPSVLWLAFSSSFPDGVHWDHVVCRDLRRDG